ncbi:MAG: DeoR/GlpR family DNA-binding transcription regulator [Spirochaetota bacterium]
MTGVFRETAKRSVTVDSLSEKFPVSRMTISRDLEKLESEGHLKRVRGGAVALSHIVTSPRASIASKTLTEEQKHIGREAGKRVSDGDFIIIESGSTCLAVVENLIEKDHLKIVTASPMIAVRLAAITEQFNKNFEIVLSGGILNVYKHFLLGPFAMQLFENIRVDIAFLSVTAIDYEAGVTADDVNESAVSKLILEKCSKKNIGLITSSKFNQISFVKVADITVFDEIITDSNLDFETVEKFESKNITMILYW